MVLGVPRPEPRPSSGSPTVIAWGLLDYPAAVERQVTLWRRRVQGEIPDTIAVVEHPPVITLGRHAPAADVLLDPTALERLGIAVVRSDRGGRATYHGPGQAVIYPVVGIADRGLGIKDWVALLDGVLIETIGSFGVAAHTIEGRPGVWVNDAKIASVGLRVARGVSYHGVSINVEAASREGFAHIVTCGVAGQRATSILDELHAAGSAAEAALDLNTHVAAARFCGALVRQLTTRARVGS